MGMSSSQARLLSLTSRMHDIEYKAQKLEAQKLQMANESAHVYQKYEDALNKTKIQGMTIGADGSAEFIDTNLLVLEGNGGDNLAATVFLKNTYNDKIYVSRASADKYKLPEDGNIGTEVEFMDRLGIEENVLGYDIVKNGNERDSYSTVDTVAGTKTTREVPILNPNWGYQPIASSPASASSIAVSTVSTFDPTQTYSINSKEDLVALQTLANSGVSTQGVTFVLNADIDMSGVSWKGIGNTEANAFKGIFDGNGHTISNLSGSSGLFTYVKGDQVSANDMNTGTTVTATYGIIKDLVLQNVNITKTSNETGALICKNTGGYVDNCYASGNIKASNWAGGLVGHNVGGAVLQSTSNVNVSGTGNCIGGFIGHDTNGTVQHCISTGDVTATNGYVGGFIGHETSNGSSFIFECATTSDVTSSKTNKGAFLGQIDSGSSSTVIGCQYSAASGLNPVGLQQGSITSNGTDDSLSENQTRTVTTTNITMPSKASVKSNIMMAMDKAGKNVSADFETALDTWLNQFYKEDTRYSNGVLITDALKLASINDYITDYLKGGNDSSVVSGLINDVKNGTTSATSAYQNNYKQTIDFEYTPYYSNDLTEAEKTTTVEIGSAENVGNNLYTILKNAGNDLETTEDVADVQNWVKSKFNTSTEAGKKALAEFNNYINNNPDPNELTKIMNAINSNSSYSIPTGSEIYTDTDTTYNFVMTAKTQTANIGWDRSNPEVDAALNFYEMVKGGYIIVDDEQASSTEWLSNMINSGTAIFSQIDRTTNKPFDTNVATNVLFQEVSDETELKKAEAEYEADMRKIDNKDKRYDVELAHLENERNAIKTEIDTLKTVAKDNVDRTFKLFG